MKMHPFAIAMMIAGSTLQAQDAPPAKIAALVGDTAAVKKVIQGWGTAVDPEGDCAFDLQDGALVITVPGGHPSHDLSAELRSSLAPRVLKEVTGDFTLQVRVDGEFQPSGDSTQPGRTGYTGAGLVLFADAKNYVRIERATLKRGENSPAQPYTNFEVRLDGEIQRYGTTGDLPIVDNKPVFLQLSRRGDIVHGAVSQDGKTWKVGEPKQIGDWPQTLLAGVAAISTSHLVFTPYFSDLHLPAVSEALKDATLEKPEEKAGE